MGAAIQLFQHRLPARLQVSEGKNEDGRMTGFPVNKSSFRHFPIIQPNHANRVAALVFDIDRPGAAMAWEDCGLVPNFYVQNPANGHAHLFYLLADPFSKGEHSATAPIRYAAAIQQTLAIRLGADLAYTGYLAKNPEHAAWRTHEFRAEPYTLGELHAGLGDKLANPRRKFDPAKASEYADLGRNCCLFETASRWAYTAVRDFWSPGGAIAWEQCAIQYVEAMNRELFAGRELSASECKGIGKSVARWVWQNFSPERLREIRTARAKSNGARGGKANGQAKRDELLPKVLELHGQGLSQRAIETETGVPRKTVARWIARQD